MSAFFNKMASKRRRYDDDGGEAAPATAAYDSVAPATAAYDTVAHAQHFLSKEKYTISHP